MAPEVAELACVASRHVERAQAFIDECMASAPLPKRPEAMGSYDDLIARADVQAIYIPLPTGLRTEWVLKAARAGKVRGPASLPLNTSFVTRRGAWQHVLVEKPVAPTLDEVKAIVATCRQNSVHFMDAVHMM
jgi:predicted dehydrogenase